jgi:VanZ family protein
VRSLWTLVGVLLVLAVCVGSLAPAVPTLPGSQSDKFEHIVAYACLAWWWGMLYPRAGERWVACFLFIAMGVALEFAQDATDHRVFDPFDMIANGAGALLGRFIVETPIGGLLAFLDRRRA